MAKKQSNKGGSPKKPAAKSDYGGFRLTQGKPESITTDLDPHLQEVVLRVREGKPVGASFSHTQPDGTVVVDVIARLKDPAKKVDGLQVVRRIGSIVTGRIAVDDIERVRTDGNVASLKRATRLHRSLNFSIDEIQATPAQLSVGLPESIPSLDGEGVIVGVVDYGGDFRHGNFRNADGTTRLLFLWDQNGGESPISPAGFGYGREFDSVAIDAALGAINPYTALKYHPGNGAHGTHVMDIAAGNGRATGNPGVAPAADLIFVNVAHDDIDMIDEAESNDTSNFGNSKMLLEAVDYIFSKANELGRRAVVNLSLGTHGGPHDGTTLAELGFDELLSSSGRAITISAGNSYEKGSHARGEVTQDASAQLAWLIHDEDDTDNELEVWYRGDSELAVSLETPWGQTLAPVALGTTAPLVDGDGNVVGRIIHRKNDPNNHDNHIDVILDSSLPGGTWRIHLTSDSEAATAFHAWIERDFPTQAKPHRQSRFASTNDDPEYTIGSISCGARTIAVGSYLSGLPGRELSPFSSAGPTRAEREKPEVSAPGQFLHPYWEQGILAAKSGSQQVTRMSGTSMASPHVAGLIALMLQAADESPTIDRIRTALIDAARRNPPPGDGWHPRYGFGRVNANAAVRDILGDSALVPTAPCAEPVPSNLGRTEAPSFDKLDALLTATAAAAQRSGARVRVEIEAEPTRQL